MISLGATVPLAPFAIPSGEEGAAPIRALIHRFDALLLCRHGVITVGPTVELAMLRMELVEHLARVLTLALPHGGVKPLPADALPTLLAKRRAAAGSLGAAAALAGEAAAPEPAPSPTAWTPAGPPPARDAWSGGATEATCGVVYGAPGIAEPSERSDSLADAVQAEIARLLRP